MNAEGYNPQNAKTPTSLKFRRLIWVVVNQTFFRYSPFFFNGWRRFLLRVFGAKIDKTAAVGRTAIIDEPWHLTMGPRSMICRNAWVSCIGRVELGAQVQVGEYVKMLTGSHDSNSKNFNGIASTIILKENVWVATGAMIVTGGRKKLTIGEGAIIGAGAVVMLNVRPYQIMVGNPAKSIGERMFDHE